MDKRLAWVGGLAAAAVASAAGLFFFLGKKTTTGGASSLLQVPLKPGNATATLAGGGRVDLIPPQGAVIQGAEATPTVFSPAEPPSQGVFSFAAFAKGKGDINVVWTDANGAQQNTFVTVTVS